MKPFISPVSAAHIRFSITVEDVVPMLGVAVDVVFFDGRDQ